MKFSNEEEHEGVALMSYKVTVELVSKHWPIFTLLVNSVFQQWPWSCRLPTTAAKTRQTVMDRPINCSSLTLEREKQPQP
jgi:hypothetical protein